MTAPAKGGLAIDNPERGPAEQSKAERAYNAFSTASVGLEMGVAVLIGFGIGYYIDDYYASAPTFTLIGLGVGVAAGFKALFRAARQAKRAGGESKGHENPEQ